MSKIAFFSTYNRDVLDLYMEYCPSEFDVSFGSPTSSLDEMIDISKDDYNLQRNIIYSGIIYKIMNKLHLKYMF